jgi:hypothetical protein
MLAAGLFRISRASKLSIEALSHISSLRVILCELAFGG